MKSLGINNISIFGVSKLISCNIFLAVANLPNTRARGLGTMCISGYTALNFK